MSRLTSPDGSALPGAKLNINVNDLKDLTCENCDGRFFREVQAFKIVSALISPTGKEQIIPIPTYRCDDCGHINEMFMPT
jgi:predicted nucleic acid-binding Zn ribbon protein